MELEAGLDLVREALTLMLMLSLPVLAAALVVGLSVSVLQAVTQIQEQTLTFVPKIVGMVMVAILALPWIASQIMAFSIRMFSGH